MFLQKSAMLKTLRPFLFLILISFFENHTKMNKRRKGRNKLGVP